MINAEQLRAARALLGISQGELAEAVGVSLSTIVDIERARRPVRVETLAAVRASVESMGIVLLDENGEGPGARLRKRKSRRR